MERCRTIAGNQTKPVIERLLAKAILKIGHPLVKNPGQEDIHKQGEGKRSLDTESIMLQSDQSVKISVPAPLSVPAGSPITSVGTMIGNSARGGWRSDG